MIAHSYRECVCSFVSVHLYKSAWWNPFIWACTKYINTFVHCCFSCHSFFLSLNNHSLYVHSTRSYTTQNNSKVTAAAKTWRYKYNWGWKSQLRLSLLSLKQSTSPHNHNLTASPLFYVRRPSVSSYRGDIQELKQYSAPDQLTRRRKEKSAYSFSCI